LEEESPLGVCPFPHAGCEIDSEGDKEKEGRETSKKTSKRGGSQNGQGGVWGNKSISTNKKKKGGILKDGDGTTAGKYEGEGKKVRG